ncbi:hypothetical protein BDA99DRAFT_536719 [Phascolomyces articulosus]|uniref:F-box domain-containing protein n=1 Tax=Phascolomyces articulosus TaxID=60185 RepID=A0AAD5PF08_9FUNG|nr:hypothetical protein BDA99DRAFT_536719 [Phascolomyces articulosus]
MDESILPPAQVYNVNPLEDLFHPLQEAIVHHDYEQIIDYATQAIDQVLQLQLLSLYDLRAHAYAMKAKFPSAFFDAQRIVSFAPKSSLGYLRTASLYSMSGNQIRAIQMLDGGMIVKNYQNTLPKTTTKTSHTTMALVPPPPSLRGATDREAQLLIKAKSIATQKLQSRVDFIAKLPMETYSMIIAYLRHSTKMICLQVSMTWRERILYCSAAWTNLVIQNTEDEDELIEVSSFIGPFIKKLVLDTSNESVRSVCLQRMKEGYFRRIQSLKLTALATQNLRPHVAAISIAFWRVQHTLTHLDINFGHDANQLTLSDILSSCNSITDLVYTTEYSMVEQTGDFSTFETHDSLVNLQIKTAWIGKESMQLILQQCPHIRRLLLDGCEGSVLDAMDEYGHNLEIVGYNAKSPIPTLEELNNPLSSDCIYQEKEDTALIENGKRKGRRLRIIYANDGGGISVPAVHLLPLLYHNMKTLENIFVNLPGLSSSDLQHYSTLYPDFRFERIIRLSFWPHDGIQQFMMQAIRYTTTLKYLSVANVHDMDTFVTTIMEFKYPLTTLRLSRISTNTHREKLLELFEKYEHISYQAITPRTPLSSTPIPASTTSSLSLVHPPLLPPPPPPRRTSSTSKSPRARITSTTINTPTPSTEIQCLKRATFRKCDEITDEILAKLSKIQTLNELALCTLHSVTAEGVDQTLASLGPYQLISLKLAEMDMVTDKSIKKMGAMFHLSRIHLESLPHITDHGIRLLVEKSTVWGGPPLDKLIVRFCPLVTTGCMVYAKNRIRAVQFETCQKK